MPIEEFLNNPEEEKIYEVLDDDKLIEDLLKYIKNDQKNLLTIMKMMIALNQ